MHSDFAGQNTFSDAILLQRCCLDCCLWNFEVLWKEILWCHLICNIIYTHIYIILYVYTLCVYMYVSKYKYYRYYYSIICRFWSTSLPQHESHNFPFKTETFSVFLYNIDFGSEKYEFGLWKSQTVFTELNLCLICPSLDDETFTSESLCCAS